ncbi:larval cuticle protein LCP-17-like [Anoplophora glabripennis]|uniref:larval cuticle protein LCP-17-like n=1 Tax=Anoplophora glabripennis TaxID=217634 RepID=UPI0008759B8E|nr:larval cuticle protein LCP-17-like [Anoplophora glabripennis]
MMKLVVFSAMVAVAFGAYAGDPKLAQIISAQSDSEPDGTFQYSFDTENGISAKEAGAPKSLGGTDPPAVVVNGAYEYTDPEGGKVQVSYVADENGYQPSGNVLPTPPPTVPIPPAIARALEYIAAHPQKPEPNRR